jgi:hypothetical protein
MPTGDIKTRAMFSLDVKVTLGGEGDSPQAKPLLKGAKKRHPEIKIDSASIDSAYLSF